jgi:hypothetical protein
MIANLYTCTRCLITLGKEDFQKAPSCLSGIRSYCKDCQSLKKKEWYHKNKEHVLQKTKQWAKDNPDTVKEKQRKWACQDKNKEIMAAYKKEYSLQNKDKINAYTAARRKRVQKQTPPWETIQVLQEVYLNCPLGMQVDHIIPLRGKLVCGLHTVSNLQYLTPTENYRKGNKFALYETRSQDWEICTGLWS